MRNAILTTEPFTCPSCISKVEHVLAKTPGVTEAKVHFHSSRVTVSFDEARTSVGDLARAVKNLGYPVLKVAVRS